MIFYSNCREGMINTVSSSKPQLENVKQVVAHAQRQESLPATAGAVEKECDSKNLKPAAAISIQDVMKDVVVYVEVRSGEDNRSEGVRKVIEALGVRINLSILK